MDVRSACQKDQMVPYYSIELVVVDLPTGAGGCIRCARDILRGCGRSIIVA